MPRELKKGFWYASAPGKTAMEKLKAIKAAGFDGVELPSHQSQDEVLRARDESGLTIATVSCGLYSRPMSSPDAATRAAGIEGVKQGIRDAKRYGATSVLVIPGVVDEKQPYADTYAYALAGMKQLVPLAEELGVILGIENVWNHFFLSPLEAARFVDELGSKAVGWHFDIGNVVYLGWPEQWIRILGKRICKLHIKEYSRKKLNEKGQRAGFAVEFLEGDCDWPAVMKALDEIGYKGWATVEPAWTPPGVEPAERLKQISEKLDKILAA